MGTTLPSPVTLNLSIGPTNTVAISANLARQGLYVFNPSSVAIWICANYKWSFFCVGT